MVEKEEQDITSVNQPHFEGTGAIFIGTLSFTFQLVQEGGLGIFTNVCAGLKNRQTYTRSHVRISSWH